MVGDYERRWSGAAKWCERIAALCLPYFTLTILLHRFGQVTTSQAVWLLSFGFVLVVLSIVLGVRALFDLWNRGYRGGKATIRGVMLAGLLLAPFIWYGQLAIKHPPLHDIATNPYAPPEFPTARLARARIGGNPLIDYDTDYADLQLAAYPRIGSRRYEAGTDRVLAAVKALVADRGWKISSEQRAEVALPQDQIDADAPEAADSIPFKTSVEAVARTRIFGFENDVVVVVEPEAEATLVDMRSASRFGQHDFGWNAELIEKFLADLDASLVGIAGEG